MSTEKINARADLKTERNVKITDKHIAVYFGYLIQSKRNPNNLENHRYLYMKDVSKKELGLVINVSQPTIRAAEQKLEELGYIYFSEDKKIMFFPDHSIYSWIPVKALQILLRLSSEKQCGGDILRLYAALCYYRDKPQEFSAKTWVYAFGLSETNQSSYLHIHVLLYVLKLYGLIDYEQKTLRARGGKHYLQYTEVVVNDVEDIVDYDEAMAPLDQKVEQYKNAIAACSEF